MWNRRRSDYRSDADLVVPAPPAKGGHSGSDARVMAEFLRFVRDGTPTLTSPVAARYAVAAGCAATESLRDGSKPVDVPALDTDLAAFYTASRSQV